MDFSKLIEEQKRLSRRVSTHDEFERLRFAAGADIAYFGEKAVCAAVVTGLDTLQVIEEKHVIGTPTMPYIPGLLSYRESPLIIQVIGLLENKPGVLFVDGNGILHPRKFGIASHIGLLLDMPTIGVAKKLLVGENKDGKIIVNGQVLGQAMETKEHAKPIFISPGHRISLKTAISLSEKLLYGYKLPFPLHEAHKAATKVRRKELKEPEGKN
jgi:deoxyribonuclease V